MGVILSDKEREDLRLKHRREHDRRIADRIKAVFLGFVREGMSCLNLGAIRVF